MGGRIPVQEFEQLKNTLRERPHWSTWKVQSFGLCGVQIIVDTQRVETQTSWISDVDNEDTRWTHEQLAEFPNGAFGSDGVYRTCEQWAFRTRRRRRTDQ